jgi:iron(III) transport system ATP-binding protein
MHDLTVAGVARSYGATRVLHDINLTVPGGSLTAILGPSGCGKTTLLRLIAGFDEPDAGTIRLGDRVLYERGRSVPPERREIGYVAQEGALFPHLTVAANVAFGLRGDGRVKAQRSEELLLLVGLDAEHGRRYPHQLSGGQQQRVALARALAPDPKVILLDEPFASLDAGLRETTRRAVASTLATAGATAILVTHDQAEALSMADQVAIMRGGRLAQVAAPADLYQRPADADVANSLGEAVILPADIRDGRASCALGLLAVGSGARSGSTEIVVRPEQVVWHGPEGAHDGAVGVPAQVLDVSYFGHDALVRLRLSDGTVVTARPPGYAVPTAGESLTLRVLGSVHAFEA